MLARLLALPLLLVPLTACSLSSDPAADSVGRLAHAGEGHTGGEDESRDGLLPPRSGAPTLTFDAPADELKFVPATAKAKPGVVNVRFTTDGSHNLALAGPGIPVALLWGHPAGYPVDVTHAVELEAGTYRFYCSIQGHAGGGMKGTLTVG